MAITATDIKFKFSVKTGSAGDTTGGTAAGSLGKYVSTTEITDATLNNLFDDVTGDENAALEDEYRCIFVHNDHGSLTLQNAVVWMSAETADGADCAIAIDDIGATPKGQAGAQADEVADEDTAPSGESFSSPTTKGTGLALGDIDAAEVHGIWVQRSTQDSAALDNDSVTIRVEGDTAA